MSNDVGGECMKSSFAISIIKYLSFTDVITFEISSKGKKIKRVGPAV